METYTYSQIKNKGIVTNAPTTKVAWATGRNVRFSPGAVSKVLGKTVLATLPSPLPIRDLFTFKGHDQVVRTLACCDTAIYSLTNDFGTRTDITPAAPPTSGAGDVWSFTVIGGMLVLSNGKDKPWKWADLTGPLTLLNSTNEIYRYVDTHLKRLIAAVSSTGLYGYQNRVWWSAPLSPATITLDKTQKMDREDLSDPMGRSDALEEVLSFGDLGKRKVLYTTRNIWVAEPVDSPMQHSIDLLYPGVGLLASRLQVVVKGVNYIMGQDDIYKISSEGIEALGFDIRNLVVPNLNRSALSKSFSFYKPSTREIYFCVPTASNTTPDTAYVLNVELNNFSICDVDFLSHTYAWQQTVVSWDDLAYGTWDSWSDSRWDEMDAGGLLPYEIVGNSQGQILKLDDGYNNNGVAINGFIETGDLIKPPYRLGAWQMYPDFKPQESSRPVMIQAGVRETMDEPIKWTPPQPFTLGVSEKVGFFKSGKFLRYRFFTDQLDSPFILEGYRHHYNVTGG